MKLAELLENMDVVKLTADPETQVTGLVSDSRKVTPGCAFIAVRGYDTDGHRFIPSALEKGAAVIIGEEAPQGVPAVLVRDSRRAMAVAAGNLYGNPSRKLHMIGVTGTNGKTTTTNLIKTVLEKAGAVVGLIGTNRNMIGGREFPAERTTPDCLELQKLLADMAEAGCTHVVMEVSSHALFLDRVYGIDFDQGIFTNLTEDHLDFHKTMEAYAQAKARLFGMCRRAVINIDDPWAKTMLDAAGGEAFTYSAKSDSADLTARDIKLGLSYVRFCALMTGRLEKVTLPIPGLFSVYNALAAIACAVCAGVPLEAACAAMAQCAGVKGRAEVVPTDTGYTGFATGRTIVLFGCGGDRDPMKRPIMGKIAMDRADYVIVTSDNPRTERPEAIVEDILVGVRQSKKPTPVDVLVDRREAIAHALSIARPGDVVILAGKGHETYQEIDHVKRHFDEREVVAEALQKFKAD